MTAKELYEALQGVPEDALCGTISFSEWPCKVWTDGKDREISPDHAAALQRDRMSEYLHRHAQYLLPEYWHHGTHESWSITKDRRGESYPTRPQALAAAVRYVAGQKGAEK